MHKHFNFLFWILTLFRSTFPTGQVEKTPVTKTKCAVSAVYHFSMLHWQPQLSASMRKMDYKTKWYKNTTNTSILLSPGMSIQMCMMPGPETKLLKPPQLKRTYYVFPFILVCFLLFVVCNVTKLKVHARESNFLPQKTAFLCLKTCSRHLDFCYKMMQSRNNPYCLPRWPIGGHWTHREGWLKDTAALTEHVNLFR